jgi:hypothetical protein
MAELAYPLSRGARAIGFDAFGCCTTLFEHARVVLVWLFLVFLTMMILHSIAEVQQIHPLNHDEHLRP